MQILKLGAPAALIFVLGCGSGLVISNGIPDSPHPLPPPAVIENDDVGHVKIAHLGIPPGHLPPPGECRIWFPGRPPGHQPAPGVCAQLEKELPAGAWLLRRPERDDKHVFVSVYDESRPSVVIAIRIYEAESGRFVSEEKP